MTHIVLVDVHNVFLDEKFIMALGSKKKRKSYRYGAATTRVVTASTVDEAKEMSIDHVRSEIESGDSLPVTNASSNPPIYKVVEMRAVEDEEARGVPNAGFTWFPEDEGEV